MAASLPLLWPAHTCSELLASITSGFITFITHFPIILRSTSPTPIGRTAPSTLFRGINWLARIASILSGSTYSVHSFLAVVAMAAHRSVPDFLNDLHPSILLKPLASMPDGPLEP